ncbi:unnamed protein product [Rotaria sp. Silwood2]|nr:unnamed protein product [Rotaria sp. Silwood2]
MGIHSNTAIFGNVGIIAIGDFYQCSPVASSSIYSSLLWSDHFEYVELKINERQKTNVSFSQMLNRIRKIKKKEDMSKEDRDMLEKCYQRFLNKEYHPEALHLFARNAQVDIHNEEMVKKICTNIRTFYEVDKNDKEINQNESKHTKRINKPLQLAKHAKVMITKNICVNDGLANGVTGHIVEFVENNNGNISHIIIRCDSPKVGRLHRVTCPHCHGQDTICVIRESNTIDQLDYNSQSKKGTKQFPLRLSWAMTIHKAQGITVDQVVISTKDLFGSGMGYTALSRVRNLEGLFLIDLHVNKFYCNENVDKVLSQMKIMRKKRLIYQQSPQFLNILFHNIEGLKNNFQAFSNYHLLHKTDLICLAETWLKDDNRLDHLQIIGYNFIHKTRACSFVSNHSLHSQKGGGVAIYFRETIPIKKNDSYAHENLECITVEIGKNKIVIIVCYRSPQQDKKEFIVNLIQYLKKINIDKNILLIGDFNEDSLENKSKPIETNLQNLGFVNIFKDMSTTNNLTSLDCIYSNFILDQVQYRDVTGIFYSFHDALVCSIDIENIDKESNKEIEFNNDEKMDTDTSLHSSLSFLEISKKTNKRKKNTTVKSNHMFKKVKVASTVNIHNNVLKEKQRLFLRNYPNIKKGNCLEIKRHPFTFNDQLSIIGLKKINIIADGNCFFRAISHQLYRHENSHLNIRSETINYLIQNMNDFTPFIDEMYSTIENYIQQMSKDGTYADHLALSSTAVIINKNIIIHELEKKPLLIPGSDFLEDQLHLFYDPNIPHYDSVVCIDGSPAFLSSEHILFT